MSLFVFYNCATCSELLEYSIIQMLPVTKNITIHYQTKTNVNTLANKRHFRKYVKLAQKYHLELFEFWPDLNKSPKSNETQKRNIAYKQAQLRGANYFMSIDEDEIYDSKQLQKAFQIFIDGDWDSSVCRLLTYYKKPTLQVNPPEDYYTSVFYIVDSRLFIEGLKFPVKVDPARKMKPNRLKIFNWEELTMHHYSYVRKNIKEKLRTQSASVNFKDRIDDIVTHFKNHNGSFPAYWGGKQPKYFDLKEVNNQFNIKI